MSSTTRGLVAVDRVVTLLAGLVLVVAGVGLFAWHEDYLRTSPLRIDATQVSFDWMPGLAQAAWWPWVTGAAGIVLGLGALVWLLRHLTAPRVGTMTLPGSGAAGALRLDVGAAADAAAHDLTARCTDVRSCRGHVGLDRGQLVAVLEPTIEPGADLAEVQAASEAAAQQLVRFVGRSDLTYRVAIHVARREHAVSGPRVR